MPRRAYQPHEAPIDALGGFLQEWEEEFFEYWRSVPPTADATYPEIEEARETETLVARLHVLCERAPAVFRMMLHQELPAVLHDALREIAEVPLHVDGFDARRLHLLPNHDLVWHHVDLALVRDAIAHVERDSAGDRQKVYQLLAVTAVEHRISPIAAWYLERAARLLLYGLEIECTAMCRAVLEAALRFKITDAELDGAKIERRGWNSDKQARDFDLAGRIEGARRLGLWDRAGRDRATLIRTQGNDVLHPGDPDKFERLPHEVDASQRVIDLAGLLRGLFPVE